MSAEFDNELRQDFLVEAGELVQALGEQLIGLEANPHDSELLNAVFRAFHTVKGGAGFLAIEPMVQLCHHAEDLLNGARNGAVVLDASLMDALLEALQRKPDGGARLVLAYLSIGEAEDYRSYWQRGWQVSPPAWLGAENPDWPGNYAVQYWDPQWQRLIMGTPDAYLDRIVAAGFDGLYLDRIDAFDGGGTRPTRSRRMQLMAHFVAAIAAYARALRPGFIVVAQNAEELLDSPAYSATLDAVAKEDLFFGLDGDGVPNAKSALRASLGPLQRFQASGKPVFLVEYLDSPESEAAARKNAAAMGAPLFIGSRELDDVQSR